MSDVIRAALEASRDFIADMICAGQGYGFFCGGDPRKFTPDEEVCSEEEIAAHKKACAEWDAGDRTEHEPHRHVPLVTGDGRTSGWTSYSGSFGMGAYEVQDERAEAAMALVVAALETLPNGDGTKEGA